MDSADHAKLFVSNYVVCLVPNFRVQELYMNDVWLLRSTMLSNIYIPGSLSRRHMVREIIAKIRHAQDNLLVRCYPHDSVERGFGDELQLSVAHHQERPKRHAIQER